MTDAAGRVQLRRASGRVALITAAVLVFGWYASWPYIPMLCPVVHLLDGLWPLAVLP